MCQPGNPGPNHYCRESVMSALLVVVAAYIVAVLLLVTRWMRRDRIWPFGRNPR